MADPGEKKSLNLIDKELIEDLLQQKEYITKDLEAREKEKEVVLKEQAEVSNEVKEITDLVKRLDIDIRMSMGAMKVSDARQEKLDKAISEEEESITRLEKSKDKIMEDKELSDEEKKERISLADEAIKASKISIKDKKELIDAEEQKREKLDSDIADMQTELSDRKMQLEEKTVDSEKLSKTLEKLDTEIIKAKSEIKSIEYSPDIVKYEKEKEVRANHATDTFPNAGRIEALLNGKNNQAVLEMFDADTGIMVRDIRELLGNPSESLVNNLVEKSGATTADEAMRITQASLFDIKSAGIEERIQQAAKLGLTHIALDKQDVPATHILALVELRYKVTHTDNKVIIDWGWATES